MAFCRECSAEMGMRATSCDACGFKFPRETSAPKDESGFEYSDFAEFTLIVGAFCSIIAAIVLGFMSVAALAYRQYQNGLLLLLQSVIACAS